MSLKLLVASTPRTGNTWLRLLLSEVYRLPMPQLSPAFSERGMTFLPPRWVAQQYYRPGVALLEWGEREGVVFLTTVRHPGDVLVSLRHGDPAADLEAFPYQLALSLAWKRSGRSILVRYEDLCEEPEAELSRVVSEIHARRPESGLPLARVPAAVAACDIDLLRRTPDFDPRHFRRGGSGGWARDLPDEVIERLRTGPPYPEIFASLGYSADPSGVERKPPRGPRSLPNPFAGVDAFEDGTAVTPTLERIYFSLQEVVRDRLLPLAPVSEPTSFLSWLTSPATDDPHVGAHPLVTNLAMALRAGRPDIQHAYPDPFGADRVGFTDWFVTNGASRYALGAALVEPVRASRAAWNAAPAAEAPPHAGEPVLTNLAMEIRRLRPDVAAMFPELHGPDRFAFARWFVSNAPAEEGVRHMALEPVRRTLSIPRAHPGLKLAIVSTPKSGNTWLRLLLREVYGLPMPELPVEFSQRELSELPESWVAQQHYFPSEQILNWGDREQAVFLTTIRHPGDVLVSLYHYVRAYADDPRWQGDAAGELRHDRERPGEHTIAYVREGFLHYLDLSLAWIANRRSIIVRYEDLCRDPDGELARVVREIHARRPDAGLPLARVAGAVAACEIGQLREGLRLDPKFFRKGGSGGWADELPPEVLEMFRTMSPYPERFAALGYSPDPARVEKSAPRGGSVSNPFEGREAFEDGTKLAPFLVRLYLSLDDATRSALHPLAGFPDPSSYLAWLCAPAAGLDRTAEGPLLTNLAAGVHAVRPDLQKIFPDPLGRDRDALAEWFVHNVERDHGFDAALVAAARESWSAWVGARA